MESVKIDTEYIKLGQLLKLAGIADSGVHAKILILNGEIKVNEQIEMKRGKKIYKGNIIDVLNHGKIIVE